MGNVEITKMTLKDLELIKNELSESFDDFWNYNVFKSELLNPNSKYIIAKIQNKPVGFAGIWQVIDEIHITNIVTAKAFRNNGIASIMLKKLLEMVSLNENINSITLEVNANNVPAKKLYEKFGFRIVGLRKKYYNNIDDAIIMTKEF